MPESSDLLQGTLDLLILRTLAAAGPMHGWGVAQRIVVAWVLTIPASGSVAFVIWELLRLGGVA